MVSSYDVTVRQIVHYTVNACLFPLPAVHGLAITTVEGVGKPNTGLHKVQKRLIESHGLQCGFCTPGFVMSAFTLLRNNPSPSRKEVEKALEGNLCRCTGYRPILSALDTFTKESCPAGDQCCKNRTLSEKDSPDEKSVADLDKAREETQVPIFPSELQLNHEYYKTVRFSGKSWTWINSASFQELLSLKSMYPNAPIIMGNTAAGLQLRRGDYVDSQVLLYGGRIPELKKVEIQEGGIECGAAVTLTELSEHLKVLGNHLKAEQTRHFRSLFDMIERYGADQIRNVATLGGSIMTGELTSDVAVIFLALNASVTLTKVNGERTLPLSNIEIRDGEVLKSVFLPFSEPWTYSGFFKQAGRRTFSHAIVNGGISLKLSSTNFVEEMNVSFGGVAGKRAWSPNIQDLVSTRVFDNTLMEDIIDFLTKDATGERDPDQKTKTGVAIAFLFKFFQRVKAELNKADMPISLTASPAESTQFFDPCTEVSQSDNDAVGKPIPHVSSEAIVSGEAGFIDDMPKLEGELFLYPVTSSRAHAKIVSVDPGKALKEEGVHSYIDYNDIPGRKTWGIIVPDEELFASEEVVYVGQPVGAILADTRETAIKAASLVNIYYEDLPAIITFQDAIEANSFYGDVLSLKDGDVIEGFKISKYTLSGEWHSSMQEHFYMEPHAALTVPKVENNELEIFADAHHVQLVHESVSKMLLVPQHKITVKVRRLGGSFGGKETRHTTVAALTAVAAYKYKRPVRSVLTRELDMAITGKRHDFYGRFKVGFQEDGKIEALQAEVYNRAGSFMELSITVLDAFLNQFDGTYKLPNVEINGRVCKTNIPPNTAFRGFGGPPGALLVEDVIFNIATQLGLSQEKVRERNFYSEGEFTPYGYPVKNCTIQELWTKCKKDGNVEQRRKEVQQYNSEHLDKKRGMAVTGVKFGMGLGPTFFYQGSALVNIYKDGTVLVTHGGVEMGQGINTKMIQIASRSLDVPVEKIYTNEMGTHTSTDPTFTAASMGTDFYGPAVIDACNILSARLQPLRDKLPDASWETLIEKAYYERVKLAATGFSRMKKDCNFDRENKIGTPYEYFTFGVACSEVEIDVLTGENQVLQTDIVFDVGKSLNPAIDIGQIEGGFIQGLGYITSEEIDIDVKGRMTNCSPVSYKIPNVTSIPRKFNVTLLKNHDYVTTVYSSKGIGEPPLLLSISVLMAIKEAVKSARAQVGLHGSFPLFAPATVNKIREACAHQIDFFRERDKLSF